MLSADDVLEADVGFQRGAGRVERHTPGLIADNAIGGDLAPALERLYRGFRVRPEVAVYALWRRVPVAVGRAG